MNFFSDEKLCLFSIQFKRWSLLFRFFFFEFYFHQCLVRTFFFVDGILFILFSDVICCFFGAIEFVFTFNHSFIHSF